MKINVGFIGAGNMGTAIMKGILNSSLNNQIQLFAADQDSLKIEPLKKLGSKYAPNNTKEALDKEIQVGINNLVILKLNIDKISGKQAIELMKE